MRTRSGFSLIDTMISLVLMSSILATVFSVLATSQASFQTNGAFLDAQQRSSEVAEMVANELRYAQVISYYINNGAGQENVLMYIQFQKLNSAAGSSVVNGTTGLPSWDTAKSYSILWCPNGAAGNPVPFWGNNPCGTITGYTPRPGELVLLQQNNTWGAPVTYVRTLAPELQRFSVDGARGFEFAIVRPPPGPGNNNPPPSTTDVTVNGAYTGCGYPTFTFACNNQPGHPFQFYPTAPSTLNNPPGYFDAASPLYLRVELTVRGVGKALSGTRRALASAVRKRVFLVNRQDD